MSLGSEASSVMCACYSKNNYYEYIRLKKRKVHTPIKLVIDPLCVAILAFGTTLTAEPAQEMKTNLMVVWPSMISVTLNKPYILSLSSKFALNSSNPPLPLALTFNILWEFGA